MRPKSYVGITGFTYPQQITNVLRTASLPDSDVLVMVGVLVSNRTMKGATNKWPNRYPSPERLKTIFAPRPGLLNLVHFNTDQPKSLFDDLRYVQDLVGQHCDGFQLNMAWPDPRMLERYQSDGVSTRKIVVLQCGSAAMKEVSDPNDLARRLYDYEGLIDYVLIDPSGGHGVEFDSAHVHSIFSCLSQEAPGSIGFGVAGGLSAATLSRLEPLLAEFDFSIDAEGKLRDVHDDLVVSTAALYLRRAIELYRKYRSVK